MRFISAAELQRLGVKDVTPVAAPVFMPDGSEEALCVETHRFLSEEKCVTALNALPRPLFVLEPASTPLGWEEPGVYARYKVGSVTR